ncbi:uncharacterized protein [Panulirus ornatus]|uniref:uncharacterized protein isoform X2 n=1 Tax=Panulirus ornatus TaxID=150431 RepID=UPI003A8B4B52
MLVAWAVCGVWAWGVCLAQDPASQEDLDAPPSQDVPSVGPEETLVLSLQESGQPSSSSYARLLTSFPELGSFTVCYRLLLLRFREESTLMSYAVSDDKDNEIRMDHRQTGYKVVLRKMWAKTEVETPLRYWSHFCFTYHSDSGRWQIFVDGERQAKGEMPAGHQGLLQANGSYIIGQEQDTFGGGFQRDQSFSGEITHLNYWARVLDGHTIRQAAACRDLQEGDALRWSTQRWRLSGEVRWRVRPKEEVCDTSTRTITIFLDRFTLPAAINLCQVVGGELAVPREAEENTWLYNSSKIMADTCSAGQGSVYLWLGANDEDSEGRWVHWGSGQPLEWLGPWRGGAPNGDTVENCLVMLDGKYPSYWSDIACLETYSFCVACEFSRRSTLHMKGAAICHDSPFNSRYVLGEQRNGRPSLAGYFHSDIYWHPETNSWVLRSLKVEGATASWAPMKDTMYPFGTQQWELGTEVCGMKAGTKVPLTISVCSGGQFTCADGTCIDLSQRCDLRVDCRDQSDESSCSVVDVPPGYSITIPPPPPTRGEPLPVALNLNLIAFPSIITQDLTLVASFKLSLRWRDVRLNFLDLKDDLSLNLLSAKSVEAVWSPRVFFSNAKGNVFTNLDQGSRIECVREGPSRPGPPHHPVEVNIFSGYENSLEMSQLYTVTYTCDFDLVMFPFDFQVCSLWFTMVSASSSYLTLVPTNITYSGQTNLIEYTILRQRHNLDHSDVEREVMNQDVRARSSDTSCVTSHHNLSGRGRVRRGHAGRGLLRREGGRPLLQETSNSLPKTSYFKMVDVWLFFSVVIIFLMIILQTLVEFFSLGKVFHIRKRNNVIQMKPPPGAHTEEPGLSVSLGILLLGRILIPVIVVIFNSVYWGAAFMYFANLE